MNKFKSKDYHIIYIRYYANKYLLKKYYDNPNHTNLPYPKQQYERAEQYNKFIWELFTHLTGISHYDWGIKYSYMTRECAFDELGERFGILNSDAEGALILLIPKGKEEIFEWIKDNVKLPYKVVTILKHIPLSFLYDENPGLNTWRRKESEEWSKEHGWGKYLNK